MARRCRMMAVNHPKAGKKKSGIKAYAVISANENLPCDVKFTSAATNDSFMLAPSMYSYGEIVAIDRAFINYEKFEELTGRNVVHVMSLSTGAGGRLRHSSSR